MKEKAKKSAVSKKSEQYENEKKLKKAKKTQQVEAVVLDIPEDEIWTYQVEGLAAPRIGVTPKHYNIKKIIFILVIVVAVALSVAFSIMALMKETFEYDEVAGGYKFSRFSNTGYITELDIDYALAVEYELGNSDPNTNYKVIKDNKKPIVEVGAYVLNCDEKVQVINIGAGVKKIDPKAFYSCWALREVRVDENNPNYCDVDGVLYNKDKTTLIFRPCDHDAYLAEKYGFAKYDDNGWRIEPAEDDLSFKQRYYYRNVVKADEGFADVAAVDKYFADKENQKALNEYFKEDAQEGFFGGLINKIKALFNKDKEEENKPLTNNQKFDKYFEDEKNYGSYKDKYFTPYYAQYEKDVMTFVVPSSVKVIGEMAFNYANMKNVYLPEGLEKIETLAFFKIPPLKNVYSYKGENVADSHFTGEDTLGEVYVSLPEGLKYIGSDAFSYNREMEYIYIPDSVTYIGHHAFWDTVYKDGGDLKGITVINVADASEDAFESSAEIGENWKPKYDWLLFKKNVDVLYGQKRAAK